jgi:hypothetical protein
MAKPRICPECDHEFHHGWDGIDSHWRSKHNQIMRYEEAWPLIWSGRYKRKDKYQPGESEFSAKNQPNQPAHQ